MLVAPTSSETRLPGSPEATLPDLLRAGMAPQFGLRPARGAVYGVAIGGALWAGVVGLCWLAASLL